MSVLDAASQLIASFEGFRASPYQNPGDRPTIGFGSTFYEDGTPVTLNDPPIDQNTAQQLLETTVQKILNRITQVVTVSLTEDQTIALASFEYNTGGLSGSTLLADLNNGDYNGAAAQFIRWVHKKDAQGNEIVDQGLMYRRQKEETLFLSEPE